MGDYGQVDELLELTRQDKYPAAVCELAESFGLMLMQVEGREYRLEQMIDELAAKNKELNAMLARIRLLENIKEQLSKFVPRSVKSLVEKNPENPDLEKRDEDVTVLFLDIEGYTRLSEQVEQERVNYLVETYFSSFLDVILENGGDINETAGDGLMILFRNPDRKLHALSAVKAAIDIRSKAQLINEAHLGRYEPVIVNMGINSGPTSLGSTRFECLAGTRWTFTASGQVTIMAARFAALAAGGAILTGHETQTRVCGQMPLEPIGKQPLKNIREPVPVYRVI